MKVIIVEDSSSVALTIEHLLGPLGYQVSKATNAAELRKLLLEVPPPDLVFLDLSLPDSPREQTAMVLIKEIREANANAVVVVLTGHPEPELRALSEAAGANAHWNKLDSLSSRRTFYGFLLSIFKPIPAYAPNITLIEKIVEGMQTA